MKYSYIFKNNKIATLYPAQQTQQVVGLDAPQEANSWLN